MEMNVRRQFSQRDAEQPEGRESELHKRWFSFRAEELERHQSRSNKGGSVDELVARYYSERESVDRSTSQYPT